MNLKRFRHSHQNTGWPYLRYLREFKGKPRALWLLQGGITAFRTQVHDFSLAGKNHSDTSQAFKFFVAQSSHGEGRPDEQVYEFIAGASSSIPANEQSIPSRTPLLVSHIEESSAVRKSKCAQYAISKGHDLTLVIKGRSFLISCTQNTQDEICNDTVPLLHLLLYCESIVIGLLNLLEIIIVPLLQVRRISDTYD